MNFTSSVAPEEIKSVSHGNLKCVTMSQFMRNVHSKRDLVYALKVKGRSRTALILLNGVCRLVVSSREALLHSRVP